MKKMLFVPAFCVFYAALRLPPGKPHRVSGYYILTSGDELNTPYLLFDEKDSSFCFGASSRGRRELRLSLPHQKTPA